MADAHREIQTERKKDKRHRANRQKLTRKRTDGHEQETFKTNKNIVNDQKSNVKKHLEQIRT